MMRRGRAPVAATTSSHGECVRGAFLRPLLALALAMFAPSVHAQAIGPTFLSWSGCIRSGTASTPFDCLADGGSVYTVVGSFALADSVAHAVSMDIDLDVTFPSTTDVPDFWNVGIDGCSPLSLMLVKGTPPGCPDDVNAFCDGDTMQCDLLYSTPVAHRNVLHIAITVSRAQPGGVRLAPMPNKYFAFALNIPMSHAANCVGCATPVRINWSSGTIYAVDDQGHDLPPVTVSSDYVGASGCATANGLAACGADPVLRTTWGRLKSLYR